VTAKQNNASQTAIAVGFASSALCLSHNIVQRTAVSFPAERLHPASGLGFLNQDRMRIHISANRTPGIVLLSRRTR
jgi:hypothetical protein